MLGEIPVYSSTYLEITMFGIDPKAKTYRLRCSFEERVLSDTLLFHPRSNTGIMCDISPSGG